MKVKIENFIDNIFQDHADIMKINMMKKDKCKNYALLVILASFFKP